MGNRRITLAAAVVAAVIVLLVTLLAGPEVAPERERLSPQELARLNFNSEFNPDGAGGEVPQIAGPPIQDAGKGAWIIKDPDTGRTTLHEWDHITPRPHGVYDLEHPVTRIIFSPSRVIEITADQGQFAVEEKQFQNGTLSGNIVIRLLERGDDLAVDLKTDRDLQMKLMLDEADFDMELGELVSESVVRVTGPRIVFHGKGLILNYNRLHSRVDRLIIERDIDLWFTPQQNSGSPSSATSVADVETASDSTSEAQFYIARFEEDVVVDADQHGIHMTGDLLTAVFSLENDPLEVGAENVVTHTEGKLSGEGNPGTGVPGLLEGEGKDGSRGGTLPGAGGGVHITCSGRLIVVPYDLSELARPDEGGGVLLALVSESGGVSIVSDDGQSITAARVDYLTTTGWVRAEAGEAMAMRIVSREMGELTGQSLSLDPAAGVGHVIGPGVLLLPSEDPLSTRPRIDWTDRLDLTFFTDGADDAALVIRTAAFHGDAHMRHPELNMDGDTLIAAFERREDQRPYLRAIDATGQVQMVAMQSDDGERMSMKADAMHIDMTLGEDGREQPTRLLARGHVLARQPGMLLETQSLDVALGFVEVEGESPASLTVKHMTAERGVEVTMEDPAVRLIGDRMLVDVATGQMQLFGTADAPARAVRADGELSGRHLVFDENSETVHVVGRGMFTFDFVPEPGSDEKPRTRTVTSTDTMLFDLRANFAQFVGDVVAIDRSATDETIQTCDDLRLDFERVEVVADPRSVNVGFGGKGDHRSRGGKLPGGGKLRIRTAMARGTPVLKSRSFSAEAPDVDLTRFHLEGPLMTFDNTPGHELAQVVGPGKMLIEDYRPADEEGETSSASPFAVQVSGRGQTLFVWQKQLTAARHDMLLEGQVQMVHRPTGAEAKRFGEVVLLDCNQLYADLSESQGMDGWLSDSAPKLNINMIIADRDVRIIQARKRAYCDRLIYSGETNRIELLAARGKLARIEDEDNPTPMTGEAFYWDMDRDIFEVMRPGAATVPLPR